MLHHLVSHALPLAHGEWLEMFRLFEGVVLRDESFRTVSLGSVPKVLAEIRVVIVDEDDGVGLHFVPFNEQNHDYPHLTNHFAPPAMEVFLLATWGTMALQVWRTVS